MSLIEMLEDLYVELVRKEEDFKDIKAKLENVLEEFYKLNPKPIYPEYLDTCPVGSIVQSIIEGKDFNITVQDAKHLQKYVVIKCEYTKLTVQGNPVVYWSHLGARIKKQYSNSNFDGVNPSAFEANSYYLICDEPVSRKHIWTFAYKLSEEDAVRIKDLLKQPVGAVRHHGKL